ncbi:unnamed protein product [Coffea canephora]|uniref:Uncharacterized protein n=1 Tax=Coffea canephora TaxID=49390 RepID=A0A068UE69_COFCA|nr:unnamed protein product [Coffea canephora]
MNYMIRDDGRLQVTSSGYENFHLHRKRKKQKPKKAQQPLQFCTWLAGILVSENQRPSQQPWIRDLKCSVCLAFRRQGSFDFDAQS